MAHRLGRRFGWGCAALEGERKQVTVLFVDVKGSMDLAESLDPEVFHRVMERFAALLAERVHRFEGTVSQFTGDGIMALFGAPLAHEDHAQRACWAALHLGEALRRSADDLRLGRWWMLGSESAARSGSAGAQPAALSSRGRGRPDDP